MSKQEAAQAYWDELARVAKIEYLCQQALDYSYPAGQAQAGIQLARMEVPLLLDEIRRLKEQINARDKAAA